MRFRFSTWPLQPQLSASSILVASSLILAVLLFFSPIDAKANASEHSSDAKGSIAYRPEIDGLRAIAVIPVVLNHFRVGATWQNTDGWVPGGFVGVDIFFVISGYLITSILVKDLSAGTPLNRFWMRRLRRLFPAVAVLLVFVMAAGSSVFMPGAYSKVMSQVVATLFMAQNFYAYYNQSTYFGVQLDAPLRHCWSLAIEEQFYVVYPFVLALLWKLNLKERGAFVFQLLIIMASTYTAVTSTVISPDYAYYLMPSRAWELALGGVLALQSDFMTELLPRHILDMLAWIGVALMVGPMFAFTSRTPYPSYRALMPCIGTALFIATTFQKKTSCGDVMSWKPLVFIGKISYSLYLWHWPIYILLAYSTAAVNLDIQLTVLGVITSLLVACVSYFWIEQVFRSKKFGDDVFLRSSVVVWLLLVCAASYRVGFWPDNFSMNVQLAAGSSSPSITTVHLNCQNRSLTLNEAGGKCLVNWSDTTVNGFYSVNASTVDAASIESSQRPINWGYNSFNAMNMTAQKAWNVDWGFSRKDDKFKFKDLHMNWNYSLKDDDHNNNNTNNNKIKFKALHTTAHASWNPLTFGTASVPDVVVLGDSHCVQYADTLKEIAISSGKTIAFMCRMNSYVAFGADTAWDTARLSYLQTVKPKTILVIELWPVMVNRWEAGVWPPTRLGPTLDQLGSLTDRLLLLETPPVLPMWLSPDFDGSASLLPRAAAAICYQKGNCKWLETVTPHEQWWAEKIKAETYIKEYIAKGSLHNNMRFLPIDHLFLSSDRKYILLLDPCVKGIAYGDRAHLNPIGTNRVSQLFRTEVFQERTCTSPLKEVSDLKSM